MSPLMIVGVVLALVSAFGAWQYNRANDLVDKLAVSQTAHLADQKQAALVNETNLNTIADMRETAVENQMSLRYVTDQFNSIASANDFLRQQTDKWRSRLDDETFKRPKVVARAARAAISRSMRRAECITDPKCDPNSARKAVTDPSSPSKSKPTKRPAAPPADPGNSERDGGTGGSGGEPPIRFDVLHNTRSAILSAVGKRTNSIFSKTQKLSGSVRKSDQ